jgi:nucleotide-binding universal stress UspA family protein
MLLRIRSILAANDRSDAADDLIGSAAALSALTAADLHVVHALELPSFYPDAEATLPGMDLKLEEAREAQRQQLRYSITPTVLVDSCEVSYGRPHAVILQRAREVAADLIVIGPHRPREHADRVLGSTADRVIRTSDTPCLIVHGVLSLPLRRILVPSDLSPGAQRALEVALIWGAALRMPTKQGGGTELCVLHVMPRDSGQRSAESERELHARIATAAKSTGVESLLKVRPMIREADSPAAEILRVAEEEQADLVVLGTHGHGALARALIGSVSSTVARQTEVPVLLVPPLVR